MDAGMLVRGLVIGLAIAAPVGPIGLLCIRRTLAEGRAIGFASGMGAATADGIYGLVAALGLSAVGGLLLGGSFWLRLGGGLLLALLGLRTMLAPPAERAAAATGAGLLGAYASTLALTITNPLTLLSFGTIFAGAGVSSAGTSEAALLVLGVFLGSALWWLLLSSTVALLRGRIGPGLLRSVNYCAGGLLLAFAAAMLLSLGQ